MMTVEWEAGARRGALRSVARYEWKSNRRIDVRPDVAAAEFQSLYARDGVITPQAVLERSRPDDAPLHQEFEWHDATAAEAFRLEQARYLIRSLVVVYQPDDDEPEPPQPIRYAVRVRASDEEVEDDETLAVTQRSGAYLPLERVVEQPVLQRHLIADARRDLLAFVQRFRAFSDLAATVKAVEVAIKQLDLSVTSDD